MKPAPQGPAPAQVTPQAGGETKAADRPRQPREGPPVQPAVPEIGGPKGPEPTRYGDWEKGGRCTDF
jgi:hypothetical protein